MAKSATTIEQQLDLLKSRGLSIFDIEKAKEILLDIGYYRLGFYLFPFEKSYPTFVTVPTNISRGLRLRMRSISTTLILTYA